ncbi:hypothetical protein [Bacillus suaedaesalsae]|uniref:Lipoprotein n=1 Tax=Bacillus suaedaesalsae TaxID=2810349 RepID=A0ABS2DJC8_9BACI|nr:hypothetical protein [Bacillus suaedaesalsae]MBM6618578.1 hypothetical protein [Bacillus suaedaesalsae]
MKYIFLITCLALSVACSGPDDPKAPEALGTNSTAIEVMNTIKTNQPINEQAVTVRHKVKKKDVYVEVVVNGFTFSSKESKKHVQNEGYLKVYLNGSQIDEIHQAAFILKGLPTGKHMLKLELVRNDASSYGVQKEMEVVIP